MAERLSTLKLTNMVDDVELVAQYLLTKYPSLTPKVCLGLAIDIIARLGPGYRKGDD